MDFNYWIVLTVEVLLGLVIHVMSDSSPAKIVVPPKDIKITENGVAIFYCFVTGNPKPEVTWLKNGKVIAPGKRRYTIANMKGGSLLRMSRVSAKKDTILVTCDVGNAVGDGDSASANLHIYKTGKEPDGFPIITTHPNFRVVETGRATLMTCSAAGDPPPKVRWLKDWRPVDMNVSRFSLTPTGSLRIERTKPADSGKYECVAENSLGTDYSYSANLHVRVRKVYPYISSSPPPKMTINYGESVNLTCVASGNPEPKVFWVGGKITVSAHEDVPYGRNNLILVNMKKTTNYTCVAISELGTTQWTTQVTVRDSGMRPYFVVIPQDQVVEEGGSLTLNCQATGRPLPDVVWLKNNIEIPNKLNPVKGKNPLQLTNITKAANYTCVAASTLGMVSVTAKVMIRQPGISIITKDDIDGIKHLTVKSTTPTSVTLFWWPPIRPGVSNYMVSWAEGNDPALGGIPQNGTFDTLIVQPDPDQNNASLVTVPGLQSTTTYTFTVTVMFKDGSTSFRSIVSTTNYNAPDISGVPHVLTTEKKTICTVHLDLVQFLAQVKPSKHTYYLLIVVPSERPAIDPRDVKLENMTLAEAKDTAYITAEFTDKLPERFILGDGKVYGNYVNRQLVPGEKYRIFLRVYTIDPKTTLTVHSSTAYSEVLHGDKCIRNGIIKTSTQPRQLSGGESSRPSVILVALVIVRAFSTSW